MIRERALKVVLVVVGLFFCASIYPLALYWRQQQAVGMMLSLYFTLGIFLLFASRNPSVHGSLIAFTAWSSFAHAAVMGMQAYLHLIQSREWIGVGLLVVIGILLIALAPARQPVEKTSAHAA